MTLEEMRAARECGESQTDWKRVPLQPRLGERLEEFDPPEVRRILVGHCEMRYEIHIPQFMC
jgi:hypothetical protein